LDEQGNRSWNGMLFSSKKALLLNFLIIFAEKMEENNCPSWLFLCQKWPRHLFPRKSQIIGETDKVEIAKNSYNSTISCNQLNSQHQNLNTSRLILQVKKVCNFKTAPSTH
jgi:hypothetical protein